MKGAIFDLDGTLLDSMRFWRNVVDIYLKRKGKEISEEDKIIFDALPLSESGDFLKEKCNLPDTPEKIVGDILFIIESNYKFNIPLKPYVHLFLNKLKKKNVKMCIATASPKNLVEAALERHNILDMFEFIITGDEVSEGKKYSAEIYEKALLKLGTDKETTVVFEDAHHAVKTAKEAGFFVVGVQDSVAKDKREEIKALCDVYIKNFNEYKI